MSTEGKFEELQETLREALDFTEVEVRRAENTLVFWRGGEKVGLEVSKSEVEQLFHRYSQGDPPESEVWQRVFSAVQRDAYYYLVLKYL
jgi:hypothetical protein